MMAVCLRKFNFSAGRGVGVSIFLFFLKWQLICILIYFEIGTFFKKNGVKFLRLPCTNGSILDHQNVLHIVILCYEGRYNHCLTPSCIKA